VRRQAIVLIGSAALLVASTTAGAAPPPDKSDLRRACASLDIASASNIGRVARALRRSPQKAAKSLGRRLADAQRYVESTIQWCEDEGLLTAGAPASTTTTAAPTGLGEPRTSGGITVTVKSVTTAPELTYARGVNEHNVGDTYPAEPGGTYIVVATDLTNNTSGRIDLTCGYAVDAKLVDALGRRYDPVQDLAWLFGDNPECNNGPNPGFTVPMTWAYSVPTGTKVKAFEFEDVTNFDEKQPVQRVPLGVS